ncbi:glycosyltransferase family 4 protein [Haloferula rosea]|uniref:Glycosyltransferase family 4 protein n=1 Tax=Haloferula rosea TaxID=490093 RepID=A0A934REG3_9BACT|nr:glycosyltransferase family 4 protein [Haloferula rosea]MBK1828163.1 glycosyltransferase family 4 protein [Haloferula rosea]
MSTIVSSFQGRINRPRVAVVTSTYARSQDDHQVPWMREMATRTANRLESLKVYAPSFRGLRTHEIDDIEVRRFRYAPASREMLTHDSGAPSKTRSLGYKLLILPYLIMGAFAVFAWCVRDRTKVLHIHWPFPHGLWALLPKWLLGVRVVAMCHGAELALARNSKIVRWSLKFFLSQSDEICVNSSHTAAELKRLCGFASKVVPYGATVPDMEPSGEESSSVVPSLLFCGRLIQRKGIDVLLRALPAVLAEREVKLVITGEGDRKQEWEELSRSLGLESVVRFVGFVSNEELGKLYRECSAYVHPAIHDDKGDTEGLGVVLIEALANCKPVIASQVGGIVDVILDGETGLLVPEKDEEALTAAILRVLSDDELASRLGEQGRLHASRVFDWDRCAAMTVRIYQGRGFGAITRVPAIG